MYDEIITTTGFELAEGEEVYAGKRKKYKPVPAFTLIGSGVMSTKHKMMPKSIDALEAVRVMSSNEKLCFFTIKEGVVWDKYDERMIYQVTTDMRKLTPSEKVKFLNGYKLLRERDWVRRVSRGIYMISPMLLIPTDFDREFAVWSKSV